MTRSKRRAIRRKYRAGSLERKERLAERRRSIKEKTEFEDSIQPEFTATETDEIEMYQRKLQNIPEMKIQCWNCGEMYSGPRCPHCKAFKPSD